MESFALLALCAMAVTVFAFVSLAWVKRRCAGRTAAASLFASVVLAIGLAGAAAMPAFANEDAVHHGDAAAQSHPGDDSVRMLFGDDIVWAGESFAYSNLDAANDVLAAGQDIEVKASTVAGSIRAAGDTVIVEDTSVQHSITLAGRTTQLAGTTSKTVALAAQSAGFAGETDSLAVFGDTVYINGTVHGDAIVHASSIEVGPDAVIEGTLRGSTDSEPQIDAQAKVGSLELEAKAKEADGSQDDAGSGIAGTLGSIVYGALACMVTAAAVAWLGRKQVAASVELAKTRMGYVAATGVIAAIVAPLAVIVLCVLAVTAPVGIAAALALFALTAISGGLTAAVLGQLAFKNMKRIPAALAMGAIIGAACGLPIVGTVLSVVCFAFALGCMLQGVFLGLKEKPQAPEPKLGAEVAQQSEENGER